MQQRERHRRTDFGAISFFTGEVPCGIDYSFPQFDRPPMQATVDERADKGWTGMPIVTADVLDGLEGFAGYGTIDAGHVDIGDADGQAADPFAAVDTADYFFEAELARQQDKG